MSGPTYRFGEFRVDPATRRLWKGEDGVALRPKVFDCIVYLIEHRDRAVGRDELISAVWGKVDITDGVLGQTILQARRSLDDTGKEQTTVRTVQGFGYHWVAKVDVVEPSLPAVAAPGAVPIETKPPVAPSRRRRRLVAAIAVALVAAPLAAYLVWRERPTGAAAPATIAASQTSALVLPVVVDGAGDSPAWIRLGAMDLVADRLHASGLRVVPSDNVVMLTSRLGAALGASEIGDMLRATRATVAVEPRAQRTAQGWRVSLATPAGATPPVSVHGEGADVLDAARVAADELARALGYRPPAGGATDGADLAMLLAQVDAAVLSGQLDHAKQLLESAGPDALARPDLRFQLARIDYEAGRLDAAEATFRKIVADVSAETDRPMRARALNGLGAVAFKRAAFVDAEKNFSDAIALLDRDSPRDLGVAYNGRAVVRNAQRRFDEAMADFAEARVALELAGDSIHLVLADANLGALNFNRGRYADAAVSLSRAAERFESFHVYNMELMTRSNLADVQTGLFDLPGAQANARRIEALIPQMTDPGDQNNGRVALVRVLRARGALHAADGVLATLRAAGQTDAAVAAEVGAIDARQAFADGDPRRAAELVAPVLKDHADALFPRYRTQARYVLVGAYARSGDLAAAQREFEALRKAADDDAVPPAPMYLALARAEIARAAGTDAAAAAAYALALDTADASHVPADAVEAAAAYFDWLVERGELERASVVAERVAPWAQQSFVAALMQVRLYHASGLAPAWRNALERARALAGERAIALELQREPVAKTH